MFGPAWTIHLGLAAWAAILVCTNAPDAAAHWLIALRFALDIVLRALTIVRQPAISSVLDDRVSSADAKKGT